MELPRLLAPDDAQDLALRAFSGALLIGLTTTACLSATNFTSPEWAVTTSASIAAGLVVAFIITDSAIWLCFLPFAAGFVFVELGFIPFVVTLVAGTFTYVLSRSGLGSRDVHLRVRPRTD